MEIIQVQNLSCEFRGQRVLDDISFQVHQGELFVLLGLEGAGKTSLVRILSGRSWPTYGNAWVAGCDVMNERQRLAFSIGVVFERSNLYAHLSGHGNLAFTARLYNLEACRVMETLDLVNLKDQADERIGTYSREMVVRLMIARALLHEPKVLLLDQPTRGLDPRGKRRVNDILAEIPGRGVTVFLTTHSPGQAERLGERVAILHQGRLLAQGAPGILKALAGEGDASLHDLFMDLIVE